MSAGRDDRIGRANRYLPFGVTLLLACGGCYSGDRDVRDFDGSKSIVVEVRSQEINIAHQIQPEGVRLPAAAEPTEINPVKAIDRAQQEKVIKAEQATAIKVEQSKAIEKIKQTQESGQYEVRVGLFKVKSNADQLMSKLQDLGLQAHATTKESAQHGAVTHITLSPVEDEAEAERQKMLIKEKLQISAVVKKIKK